MLENVCYGWEQAPTIFFNEVEMKEVAFDELPFDIDFSEEFEDGDLPY